jgi:hypothetical protein
MAVTPIEARRKKLEAYAKELPDLFFGCHQKLAVLDELIKPEINALVDDSYGAHAHNALCLTLLLDIVRDICAFALDGNDRATSLRNVLHMLSQPELRSAARDQYSLPYQTYIAPDPETSEIEREELIQRLAREDREEKAAAFDRIYSSLEPASALIDSERATVFRTARNKTIAHYEMRAGPVGSATRFDLRDAGLMWGDPRAFLQDIEQPLVNAVLLSTGAYYPPGDFKYVNRLYAADFLARLTGKPPVTSVPRD